jgi:hypothetical protein
MDPGIFVALAAIMFGCSIPITAIWTSHKRQVLQMQMRMQNQGDASLRATVEALQQEVRALRETSTQYDLSFDTALQRMESRMENVERRVQAVEASTPANLPAGRQG